MLSTILIIDKRKELSTKYKKSIDNTETNVIITRTLKDAFITLQNLEPDMIIISDSIEEKLADFCEKIRALTYNTRPIIVALSKSADTNDRIEVLERGADDFLSEPVNIEEFKTRILAHLRRDFELNLDNKTLLPNQKIVKKALKRVLKTDNQAVLYVGVENLKQYKQVYTELAGDKIVQTLIAIIKSALEPTDFLGQTEENVFIIVTNKYRAEKLAEFVSFAFDTVAPRFYSETDAKRGYMTLKGERYAGMRVNFVSVLIGGIMDDFSQTASVDLLLNSLYTVKNLAKIPNGSNYAFERIKLTAKDSIIENEFNKKIYICEKDESLSFLIRTSLELQGYDILDELVPQKAEQPAIIIMDSGKDSENLKIVSELKKDSNFVNTKFIVTSTLHDKIAILDSGADVYLPKPYEITDLIRWVEYFMKG